MIKEDLQKELILELEKGGYSQLAGLAKWNPNLVTEIICLYDDPMKKVMSHLNYEYYMQIKTRVDKKL
ncbi:hypothetical protein J2Z60_001801 [Lactobacillus colini]|uniref:Uncharacterized protein n=1 Tax=Lactobacillus colini TaxID=1819254 RepID=A0ABS4MFZ8_9LACO|nr:hypothetical protein [Lactobacillus colini]MBP2058613.1 hypothetical protein [Lactobacillus colini]